MKPEFLESAEFYNRRYHNFSSRVIVPMSPSARVFAWFCNFGREGDEFVY